METGKSLEDVFKEATPEQREAIQQLLKEKAGLPTMRKRLRGSDSEPDGRTSWIPHKACDNCSLSEYRQSPNDPTILSQGCPFYSIRRYDDRLGRMVCLKWANRRFATPEIDEVNDGDGVEEG
ncbi:MAG: hypothetical protein O8C67_08870 [Candidatus Methanoperedens sp.]|nr:hypothetical protein [Candidatus Methanoperedens sp.]